MYTHARSLVAWFLFPIGVLFEWQIGAWLQPLAAPFPVHSPPEQLLNFSTSALSNPLFFFQP